MRHLCREVVCESGMPAGNTWTSSLGNSLLHASSPNAVRATLSTLLVFLIILPIFV